MHPFFITLKVAQKKLYIIGGCNGAGKTTASFNMLPDILECREYVNADEIARGISPFQPEKVSVEAGRIMLQRIKDLLQAGEDFAFETTLATKSFKGFIELAKQKGYCVCLIYIWLESTELATMRVQARVQEGGHNIPKEIIVRRYFRGLNNLFHLYHDLCDLVLIYDNSYNTPELIYEKSSGGGIYIYNQDKYRLLNPKKQ